MAFQLRRSVRFVAGAAALALVASGCSGGSDDASSGGSDAPTDGDVGIPCPVDALDDVTDTVEIDAWHTEIGLPAKSLQKLADQYNASQKKVKVNVQWQGTFQEQFKKFEDSLASPQNLPAIIMPDDTVTQYMADSGAAVPATACIEADPDAKEIYDDMVPIVPAAYTVNGTLWPAAYSASGAASYLNVTHFEKAGLDPNAPIETLADLRSAAEKIKAANIPGVEAPIVMRIEAWPLEYWISGAKQEMVNNDNGRTDLATESKYDNEATQEVFEWLHQMQTDGLMKVLPFADLIAPFLAMATQSSSFLVDTSAAISTVNAVLEGSLTADQIGADADLDLSGLSFPDLRLTVGQLPGLKKAGEGQMGGAAWYIVNNEDPAKVAAAWDFIKYINGTEQQVQWAIESSYFPVRESAVKDPELTTLWTDTRAGQWMKTAFDAFAALDPEFPGPVIGPYKEFRFSVIEGLERMFADGEEPTRVVETVNSELQAQIDAYAKDAGR